MQNEEMIQELLDEIRWLSDVKGVQKMWTIPKQPSEPGYDAPEYYSVLFDDLDIVELSKSDCLPPDKQVFVSEFARCLKLAASKNKALYDVERFLSDPHFKIAQKIAVLV
jgi:hypothetical protein